jgi:hypothetical protein
LWGVTSYIIYRYVHNLSSYQILYVYSSSGLFVIAVKLKTKRKFHHGYHTVHSRSSYIDKTAYYINRWFTSNLLSLNVEKTHFMQFVTKTSSLLDLNIMHGNKKIVNTHNTKFLGLILDNTFSWLVHIDSIVPKLSSACYATRITKPLLSQEILKMVYCAYFHSIMTYGIIFWGNSCHSNLIFQVAKKSYKNYQGDYK